MTKYNNYADYMRNKKMAGKKEGLVLHQPNKKYYLKFAKENPQHLS